MTISSCLPQKNRIHAAAGFRLNALVHILLSGANSEEIKRYVPFLYLTFAERQICFLFRSKIHVGY